MEITILSFILFAYLMLQACSGQKGDPEYIFHMAIGEEMSELQEKYFRIQKPANFEKKKNRPHPKFLRWQ